MNFGVLKTRVKLRLGNMPTGHPFEPYADDWVNEALNGLILRATSKKQRNMLLFPELRDDWQDTTTADTAYIGVPADVLVVEEVRSFDKTSADIQADRANEMVEITWAEWLRQSKSATDVRYPRQWVKRGNRIYLHAVPRAAKLTDLLISSIAREATLSADADTPVLDALWHPAVEDLAVYLGATAMGWSEKAGEALKACDEKISNVISLMGLERGSGKATLKIKNDPTRTS